MKEEINHFDGRTMHIDTSRRFYQDGDSAIAFKIIPTNNIAKTVPKKNKIRGLDIF